MSERSKLIRKCNFDRMLEIFSSNGYLYSVYHFSVLQFFWGVWLLLPMQTFYAPPYEAISIFASEFAWGAVGVILGLSRLSALHRSQHITLSVLVLMSAWYWLIVGVAFGLSVLANTGMIVYIGISMYEFWAYRKLLGD